ncbi:hypothetical protein BM524_15675 [Alteromonas mediterranea]|uniref:Cohesin domain-containing protein n=1 Tax=Alteromonas mediterranea TaxID=314275 RepID=A0AAC9JDW1_9ALTE|nr:DUF6689 family protein [Alteromonas mediterranea]APD91122.1 hypothetical protein BM524_15675 [Alteromonas mediterranea]
MMFTAMKFKQFATAVTTLSLLLLTSAQAQVVSPATLTIDDNKIQAKLELTSLIEVDLTVEFENSIGLNANTIDITAELLDPTDLTITDRLPSSLTSAVSGFPVLVSISPKADAGFGFEGLAMVELYTKAIHYTPTIPWRLFTSHDGGTFEDITTLTSSGSYRARGSTGQFSDFIILLDTRPSALVINEKAASIANTVNNNRDKITALLEAAIDSGINDIQSALIVNDNDAALTAVDSLITLIENASGSEIADVWRSSGDLVNVKGQLLTQLQTLRFSLRTL